MSGQPDRIVVELLHADGRPIELLELGFQFLERLGIPNTKWERPFRVEIDGQISKGGNLYFDYSLNAVPLPEGIGSGVRVGGSVVEFGPERLSGKGNPTREGRATFDHKTVMYDATVYLSKTKRDFFVKVHAHKSSALSASQRSGRII